MKIVFVKRPVVVRRGTVLDALRATARNGKALQSPWRFTGHYTQTLRREQLVLRQTKRGAHILAWCENGTRATKKGAR